ncbi:AraC-like DNA-binding protein [Kitasatospora sp. SolWspMP-SS2h]|uniref:helix-turn-helix domain-containing protein n=1 Tax=Kitasatospora sp. SolWspMP-SS2h TaxID=1305729 RepID=UPI000DBAC111|nr:AraC family transcriptional regulator [Kitasatospora sp. SolWspMP-SS2h]RAJ41774.1 AraC-like DNA-binding protein [Kitasatospora sp. SolWspMP-SS2h]
MRANQPQASGTAIPEVPFTAPPGGPAGVEVMTLADLRARRAAATDGDFHRPQRPAFHHLLTLERGRLRHTVDFTAHTVEPGSWLWVRPGQVQQWGELGDADGTLVLFEPGFPDPATVAAARLDDPFAAAVLHTGGTDREALLHAVRHLHREYASGADLPAEVRHALLRHLLAALLLRLAHPAVPCGSAASEPGETYRRFRQAVEHHFTRTRRVEDYARLLGYSPRTLSRATLAAAGVGAKEFVDRRAVLEAKRLLAHSDGSAARIADHLGFADAANFAKFFHQRTGTTPTAFRAAVRGGVDRR